MKKKISPSVKNKTTKYLKKGIQMSQFSAVKNNAEVRVNNFQFQAAPSEFKKELITDQTYKRFHGSRTLLSWLPPGLIENTKDRFGYMFPRLRKTKLPFTDENIDLLKRLGEEMGRMDP